jgi:hypothetical protein
MDTDADRRARPIVTRLLLIVAVLALLWAAALVVLGGVDFTLFGHRVRTHEPLRPLGVAAIALILFVREYGARPAHDWWLARTRRFSDQPLAAALAIFVFIVGVTYSSTAATGSDSYGYVSQAGLWLKSDLHVAQPWVSQVPWPDKAWTFSPLGYRPNDPGNDRSDLVPTYSPGLPLLMAGAAYIGGYRAAFWIVPVSGAVLVFMTWLIGSRLGSPRAGLIGAWFVATSPVVLFMLMLPMTDVPVAAAWAVAIACVLGTSIGSATAGGLAAGLAILIRPNLFPLAGVLALRFLMKRRVGSLTLFSAGAALGMAITALINQRLYGSPLASGYGDLGSLFGWGNVLPNMRLYPGWLVSVQTPLVLAGLAAVLMPIRRFWPDVPDRSALAIAALFVLVLWAEYDAYLQFEHWTYLRFLLASWPLIMIGMGSVALGVARNAAPARALAVTGLVIGLGLFEYRSAANRGIFDLWRSERSPILAARQVRDLTDANSVIFSMSHSGSLRYYGGRMSLRYDLLDPDWLDRSVAWLAAHGAHPYLLVNDWELPQFLARFQTQHAVARVHEPPMFAYQSAGRIFLFDLLPARPDAATLMLTDGEDDLRSASPVAPPHFVLR